jgi:hypothetical protein
MRAGMHKSLLIVAVTLAGSTMACEDSCFVHGTLVATPGGDRPIEALTVGDTVLAYAHADGALVPRRVVAVHRSLVREVRTIELDDQQVTASPSHPFWVPARGAYLPVRDLREGA